MWKEIGFSVLDTFHLPSEDASEFDSASGDNHLELKVEMQAGHIFLKEKSTACR